LQARESKTAPAPRWGRSNIGEVRECPDAVGSANFNSLRDREQRRRGLGFEQIADLMDLVANGYVETGDGGEFYKLTAKGQDLLSERGGGANES
jgi:hypothetical protein